MEKFKIIWFINNQVLCHIKNCMRNNRGLKLYKAFINLSTYKMLV